MVKIELIVEEVEGKVRVDLSHKDIDRTISEFGVYIDVVSRIVEQHREYSDVELEVR